MYETCSNEVFIANISVQKIPSNCFTFSPKCKKKLDEKKTAKIYSSSHDSDINPCQMEFTLIWFRVNAISYFCVILFGTIMQLFSM